MNRFTRNISKFLLSATFTLWVGIAFSQTTESVELNSVKSFTATGGTAWSYNWTLTDPNSNTASVNSTESFNLSQTDDITFDILGDYILRLQATDDLGCLSEVITKTIVVGPVSNLPPDVVNDVYSAVENEQIIGNVLDNDSDPEGGVLSVSGVNISDGPEGTLVMGANGSFTFTPPEDFFGTIIYEYEVCDDAATSLCSTGTITFNYSGNLAPVAQNDAFTVNQDTPLTGNVIGNDSDPEGDNIQLTAQNKSTPNGYVEIETSGSFVYTPNPGFFGSDEFSYELCDDGVPSKCDLATVSITVLEVVEFDREAINDIAYVFANSSTSGQVLSNDINFESGGISVSIPSGSDAVNGNLNMSTNGSFTYQPNADFVGVDNFYYEVCATQQPAGCDDANVTIHVLSEEITTVSVILADDEVETIVNIAVSGNVLANDFSPVDDVLQINSQPQQGPDHGAVVINDDGSFVYTPEAGFIGEDYFVYEVCGQVTGECKTARVTIRVKADITPRIFAVDDVVHIFSTEIATGNLLANDIAPSGKTLTVNTSPISQPISGNVTISSNGNFSYNPTSSLFPFVDDFVYEVCDQDGVCSQATVYVIISKEPDEYADVSVVKTGPASIVPGETITYDLLVGNSGNVTAENVFLNDFLPASILNAEYQLNGAGNFSNWPGQIDLGNLDDGASAQITIRGVVANNAPDLIENFASVSSDQYDPDLTNNISTVQTSTNRAPIIVVENGLHQIIGCCYDSGLQLDASNSIGATPLSFLWEPSTNLDNSTSATPLFTGSTTTSYSLTVTASNGESSTETVTIEVMPCPEIVMANQVFVNTQNEMIMLDASESTGHKLTYSWWTANNEIIISGETTANPVVSGLGKYYLQITDSLGCSNIDSVTVGLLVQIQAVDDSLNMLVNTSVDINVIENDIPVNGIDPASVTIISQPEHGVAVVTADSLITYTPNSYYVGRDDFIYSVCDYFQNCDDATVLVIINDEALFVPNAFSPNGDGYNDLFVVKGIGEFEGVALKIFNRWGNLVYEANNYGVGTGRSGFWDGIANRGFLTGNGQVPTGTYFYSLDLGDGNEELHGFIYLDR